MEVEIGRGKKARRAYGFDDVAIVPSRRTRDPDDVDITFSQGVLTVSGTRETEVGTGGRDSFYIRERFSGAFRRSVTLPEGTDDSQIGAEFENGVVEIVVRGAVAGSEATRIPLRDRSSNPTRRSLG